MPGNAGIRLCGASPDDLKVLPTILEDLKVIEQSLDNSHRKMIISAQRILSDILESDADQPTDDHESDDGDDTWGEEWESLEMYQWILDIVQNYGAQKSEACNRLITSLEERITSLSASPQLLHEPCCTYGPSDSPPTPASELMPTTSQPSSSHPSPIELLPLELLQEIFWIACLGQTTSPLTPFHLSQVNSYFRSVALELKPIWTRIDDILPTSMTNLYLIRSGDAPLTVRIGAGYLRSPSRVFLQTWSDILAQYCGRVQSLEVETSEISMLREWASLLDEHDCRFIRLRNFDYILHKGSRKGEDTVMCPVWLAFPELRDLWIQGCWVNGWVSQNDPFPPTLKRLKISDISEIRIEKLVEALKAIPSLVTLILDDIQELPMSAGLSPSAFEFHTVTLEHLKELELSRISESEMVTFVTHIQAPAISLLSVSFARSPDAGGSKFLPDFIQTHPLITRLDIAYSTMTSASWSSILEQLPDLESLRAFGCQLSDEHLQALTLRNVLPQLRVLKLENEFHLSTSFIDRVVRTHPALESVTLRGWDSSNISKESLDSIKQRVQRLYVEAVISSPEDICQSETDTESDHSDWESESQGEWLSGDEVIVQGNAST